MLSFAGAWGGVPGGGPYGESWGGVPPPAAPCHHSFLVVTVGIGRCGLLSC